MDIFLPQVIHMLLLIAFSKYKKVQENIWQTLGVQWPFNQSRGLKEDFSSSDFMFWFWNCLMLSSGCKGSRSVSSDTLSCRPDTVTKEACWNSCSFSGNYLFLAVQNSVKRCQVKVATVVVPHDRLQVQGFVMSKKTAGWRVYLIHVSLLVPRCFFCGCNFSYFFVWTPTVMFMSQILHLISEPGTKPKER